MLVIKDPFNSDRFTEDDENILTILATPIAISLRNTQLLRGLQEAEQDVADRVRQLHTAAEIARDTVNVGMLNLDEHLSRISRLVRERFGLASAAIYLFDARSEALLLKQSSQVEGRARTVPEMEVLGGQSVISLAALRREPRLNVANSNGWFTRSNREQSEMEDELGIPILGGKELLGVFDLHLNHSPGFSQKGIEIYQVLADLIAVGILNTRLIGNIQEHLSIHRLLHHTASAAASSNTIEDALQSIANGLSVTYAGKRVAIYVANPNRCILELKSWAGFSVDEASTYTMPMDYGLIGWVADRQQPAMIPDTRLDDRHKPVHSSTLSILAVPLVYRDTLSGVLSLESDQVYGFTEIDQELVGTLGSTLAAIIANSQLLEKVQHQVDRQRRLYEITNQIRRSTDMETILKASAIELGKVLGTDLTRIEITAPPDRKLPIDPQSRAGVVEEE
jgi:GAF domain-containing protein